MPTVFIAGSIAISRLDPAFVARVASVVDKDMAIVVGDADGADTSIQKLLLDFDARDVTVYCSGDRPRNNIGNWPVCPVQTDATPGSRAFFTAKDIEMARVADFGLMMWDAKSTGTLSNVLTLLAARKTAVVFVNKAKTFVTLSAPERMSELVGFMSDTARDKAETKIGLSKKVEALWPTQMAMGW